MSPKEAAITASALMLFDKAGRQGLNLTLSFFTRRCAVSPKEAAITARALMLFDKAG